jgi:hypothetical protein
VWIFARAIAPSLSPGIFTRSKTSFTAFDFVSFQTKNRPATAEENNYSLFNAVEKTRAIHAGYRVVLVLLKQ